MNSETIGTSILFVGVITLLIGSLISYIKYLIERRKNNYKMEYIDHVIECSRGEYTITERRKTK